MGLSNPLSRIWLPRIDKFPVFKIYLGVKATGMVIKITGLRGPREDQGRVDISEPDIKSKGKKEPSRNKGKEAVAKDGNRHFEWANSTTIQNTNNTYYKVDSSSNMLIWGEQVANFVAWFMELFGDLHTNWIQPVPLLVKRGNKWSSLATKKLYWKSYYLH